ncbi:MAG: DUF4249 family protein [bacterium]|nr:DUF4249 family protein [bacterium]
MLTGLSACEKTEKVDNYPIHQSKLVVNCFFYNQSGFQFKLSKSLSPIDNAKFKTLDNPNAYIKIFEDNIFYDSTTYNSQSSIYTGRKGSKYNKTYRFECHYPGFEIVSGEDYLPDTAKIKNASGYYSILNSTMSNDSQIIGTSNTFLDINYSQPCKYLMLTIYISNSTGTIGELYSVVTDNNPANNSEFANHALYISNEEGIKKINLKWATAFNRINKNKTSASYRIRSYACSKNTFEYLKRQALQMENQEDPFSQPTPISNNIINGYGIFGGFTFTDFRVSF